MKPYTHLIGVFTLTGLLSCQKDVDKTDTDLIISAPSVKAGELVTAKVVNPLPGTTYKWLLPGPTDVDTTSDDTKRRLFYTWPGSDSIMVTLYQNNTPYASFAKAIHIKADRFTLPNNLSPNALQPITGRLFLTPFFMPDSSLAFITKTDNGYDCINQYVVARNTSFGTTITASFGEIWQVGACEPGKTRVSGILFTNTYYNDGLWPIAITFKGKPYYGVLKVSGYQSNLNSSGRIIMKCIFNPCFGRD
jgi:hypothetical protein